MSDCEICDHAAKHGSWPPKHRGTHCRDCHRSWKSLIEAHCATCHLHFSTNSTADIHEPFCDPDREQARSQVLGATKTISKGEHRGESRPFLVSRDRKHGETLVRWSPEDAGGTPWGSE